jgi:DNA-binding NtrC family response regulator
VLLDVMMPGMNGLETLRALKAAKPDLQAIMLSGREQAATIVEAVRLGAADYVVKPDDPEGLGEIALDAAIKNAIEKTRLVSEITEAAASADRRSGSGVSLLGRQSRDADDRLGHRAGVGQRRHGADPRRKRRRQGARGAGDSPALVAQGSAVRQGELRRAASRTARERAVRARERRLHRRRDDPDRQVRAGRHRHDLPRRDRRDEAALQAKLLHVLQDAQFTKLGSNKSINVDVRIVAATNRDLEAMMLRGEFREDLYYRLKVIEVTVPPLRERPRRDHPPLPASSWIATRGATTGRRASCQDELAQLFQSYEWPGNIRELENMIKRIVILQDETLVVREMSRAARPQAGLRIGRRRPGLPHAGLSSARPKNPTIWSTSRTNRRLPEEPAAAAVGSRLADVAKSASIKAERALIEDTLTQVHWNRRRAAEQLGVSYKTLLNKIKECGISRK